MAADARAGGVSVTGGGTGEAGGSTVCAEAFGAALMIGGAAGGGAEEAGGSTVCAALITGTAAYEPLLFTTVYEPLLLIAAMTLSLTPACSSPMTASVVVSYWPGEALIVAITISSDKPELTILATASLSIVC